MTDRTGNMLCPGLGEERGRQGELTANTWGKG